MLFDILHVHYYMAMNKWNDVKNTSVPKYSCQIN
jgi:hypothetical protein